MNFTLVFTTPLALVAFIVAIATLTLSVYLIGFDKNKRKKRAVGPVISFIGSVCWLVGQIHPSKGAWQFLPYGVCLMLLGLVVYLLCGRRRQSGDTDPTSN